MNMAKNMFFSPKYRYFYVRVTQILIQVSETCTKRIRVLSIILQFVQLFHNFNYSKTYSVHEKKRKKNHIPSRERSCILYLLLRVKNMRKKKHCSRLQTRLDTPGYVEMSFTLTAPCRRHFSTCSIVFTPHNGTRGRSQGIIRRYRISRGDEIIAHSNNDNK